MGPQLENLFFAFIEVFVSLIKSLEYFRDISHIETVMTLGRCWKEIFLNDVEQVNSSLSEV